MTVREFIEILNNFSEHMKDETKVSVSTFSSGTYEITSANLIESIDLKTRTQIKTLVLS